MALEDSEIVDLINSTRKALGQPNFNQVAQSLQRYPVFKQMFRRDRVEFRGSYGIQKTILTKPGTSARQTQMHDTDVINIDDGTVKIDVPFRHTTWNYAWDRRELLENMGEHRIFELIKARRAMGLLNFVEHSETAFWNKPGTSSDKLEVFGVPYWIVKDTTSTGGFNGGDPSGFSDGAGGIATADEPNWKNYAGQYTNVTKADLVRNARKMRRQTNFMNPIDTPDFMRRGPMQIYTTETTLGLLEELGEAQNENLGRDLQSMDGRILMGRVPVNWVPELDSDTSNPFYQIDHRFFFIVALSGNFLHESSPMVVPNQHNNFVIHGDSSWNVFCVDRRQGGAVLSQ